MKRLLYIALILVSAMFTASCDSDTAISSNADGDYPRILGRWPEMADGALGVFGAQSGIDFQIELQFVPSQMCVGIWYLDGVEYCRGTVFKYQSGQPVKHHIKLVVTTPEHETSREAYIEVK